MMTEEEQYECNRQGKNDEKRNKNSWGDIEAV